MAEPFFSIIVPVYNRPSEVKDLLDSLEAQTRPDLFEVVLVEDGSTVTCKEQFDTYKGPGRYFYKENEGRSPARNYGMDRACPSSRYFVFFDSDCVIPPDYFATLYGFLRKNPLDCFGGPDAAGDGFTPMQKAISHSMTSFLTTGGIRGGRVSMETFKPRTFNMGFTKEVYAKVGGFREMFSEDIDMSTRIRRAGFSIGLVRETPVWHKRRVSLAKFFRQVHVFGMSRITLQLLYPGSLKLVHALPALAVLGLLACVALSITWSWWWMAPVALYFIAVFAAALHSTRLLDVALLAVPAAAVQLGGYGTGFLRAWFFKILLHRGRDTRQEIKMRKGK